MTGYCIVCDCVNSETVYPGILNCTKCGYIYADLNMSQEEFESLYTSGYFNGEEYSDYISDKHIHQKNFRARLLTLERFVNQKEHKTLLEIGCAYGFFLELAKSKFEKVIGIDVTESGVAYATDELNLNAVHTGLLEWDLKEMFDVVCMWDTIEHLKAPDKYLEKIAGNMNAGGLVAITTGDIGSLLARFRKQKWRLIHPPTHAHYFSRDSITQLLDRYGFDVIHFEYCGFYRSGDNIAYNVLSLRWKLQRLYLLLKRLHLLDWLFYSNFYDIMYIVAQRR